jgi:integration host factor subunit beta
MDKLHLVKRIAEIHPQLKTKDAEYTVKVILDALCSTLAKGGRIEIRGFGSFSLTQRPPKQKCNPKTSGKLKEPAKYTPHFKPAKELRARANTGNGAEPFSSISNSSHITTNSSPPKRATVWWPIFSVHRTLHE